MSARRESVLWATAAAVGTLLPFLPAAVGQHTLSRHDTARLYAPVRTLVVDALRAGRLPLWNPHEGLGKPLFAEGVHSVLHPVSLAAAFIAPGNVDFLILSYLVAATLGALCLGRTLGASAPGSAGLGLAFALAGYTVSMTGNLVFLAGLSTLPWLTAAARAAGSGAPWGAFATGVATACAFFAGDAQVALIGVALGLLLAADAGGRRGAALALVGMVPGLLAAGVQIEATRELIPLTDRAPGLAASMTDRWPLRPARLLEWIVPGLFRGPLSERPVTGAGGRLDLETFAESVYLGVPLLVVAALALVAPIDPARRRTGRLLGACALVLLWMALGPALGARQALDWVPVWNAFRYSEKLMAPLALCLCGMGALGVEVFASRPLSRRWGRALAAMALAAACVLLALLLAPTWTAQLATQHFGHAHYRSTLLGGLPHLTVALCALIAVDRIPTGPWRAGALALTLALVPASAIRYGACFLPRDFASPIHLERTSPPPRLAAPLAMAFAPETLHDPFEFAARDASRLLRPSVNVAHRVDSIGLYGPFEPARLTALEEALGDGWTGSARRFALTHVVIPVPRDVSMPAVYSAAVEGARLLQRDEGAGFELWGVPHRPWAFFAARAVAVKPTPEEPRPPPFALGAVLTLIARGDGDTVVVEAFDAARTSPGRVLRVDRGTDALSVEADSEGPALLVVQDAFWPGWRASIDGRPVEILATDALVRAVRWPPGRHLLQMVYDPPGVRIGLGLSAAGALLLAALAIRAARYRPSLGSRGAAATVPPPSG